MDGALAPRITKTVIQKRIALFVDSQRLSSEIDENRYRGLRCGMSNKPLTAEQSAAGRALLGWSQRDLAEKAHLGESTVRNFEKGRGAQTFNNVLAIRIAMETAGVLFLDDDGTLGPGARLRVSAQNS